MQKSKSISQKDSAFFGVKRAVIYFLRKEVNFLKINQEMI